MCSETIAYVYDFGLHATTNEAGQNFWYAYVSEIFDQLGVRAASVEPCAAAVQDALKDSDCLVLGPVANAEMFPRLAPQLQDWVECGGILIGFACEGLDDLFGVTGGSVVRQPRDDFSLNGFFDLKHVALAADVHSYLHPAQKLLILSDVRGLTPTSAGVVGQYYYANGRASEFTAITARQLGRGWAFYFGFDVPKTVWVLHQGRPIDADYDGDGYLRTSDARVIGHNEEEVMYADEILFLLQNMIGRSPQPFICASPPVGDAVSDLLLFWGGDDEASPGHQVVSSDFMASRGLPYHINAMWRNKEFAMGRPEAERIWANGHELAVHYDFIAERDHPYAFTEEDVVEQATAFEKTFGIKSGVSVNHCLTWNGWVEPAKWMAACGATGDNSRVHSATPPLNPANQIGFSFGTAFPYYYHDDWRSGNARLDFVEQPITAYEVGYTPSKSHLDVVHRAIDLAAHYHLTMDMFYHPPNISSHSTCRAAVDEVLSYLQHRGLRAKHMGNDELARWWRARSASWAGEITADEAEIEFTARTEHPDGILVKVPTQGRTASACQCSGQDAAFENRHEFGQNWTYVVVPEGEGRVKIKLA